MKCNEQYKYRHVHPRDRFVECVCDKGCGDDGGFVDME
jgi:hypothetical protein